MTGWLRSTAGAWGVLAAVLVLPGLALASIGKVSVLEGTAKRTNGEETQALEVGSEIELNDTIEVGRDSNLKLTLTDESVIMLAEGSRLTIDEATFEGQERRGFAARLGFGKLWAKVKKALGGSEAKFEVKTERAVAGVRGTIFRVDYGDMAQAMVPADKLRMVVRVVEGRVVVAARVPRKGVPGQTPPAGGAAGKGERHQVPGPREITQEEWEQRFIELKARQQVEVGETVELTKPLDQKAMRDRFGRFVEGHP
ncbi:FecR family protein [Hyalangium versicolor]|uniref:FecR family protein n=1 Tax=Hyalangium versicolor TaxID=2861190 RepID=UPI001CCB62E6|nr:FecR family protein [Hyalangium versicolor]